MRLNDPFFVVVHFHIDLTFHLSTTIELKPLWYVSIKFIITNLGGKCVKLHVVKVITQEKRERRLKRLF